MSVSESDLGHWLDGERVDNFNFELAKEIHQILEYSEFKNGREYKERAIQLCKEKDLSFGDLLLYEKYIGLRE